MLVTLGRIGSLARGLLFIGVLGIRAHARFVQRPASPEREDRRPDVHSRMALIASGRSIVADDALIARVVEDTVGCTWSLFVLHMVREGARRPGAMERQQKGLDDEGVERTTSKACQLRHSSSQALPRSATEGRVRTC